jgi:hypothetical protein
MSVIEVLAPAVPEEDVADALERAALLLMVYGWTQHAHRRSDGSMCARGAILRATENMDPRLPDDAEDRLAAHVGWETIVGWNDYPDRTADEVIRAMREAAA